MHRQSTAGLKKKRSRLRILAASARLFRERGLQGASVNELMGGAGLTRGGFYAHFRDKEDLVAAALHQMFDEAESNLLLDSAAEGEEWQRRATSRYVSPAHLAAHDEGCLIPALSAELARGPIERRAIAATRLSAILDAIQRKLSSSQPDATREDAIALLSSYVGALTLARAVSMGPREDDASSEASLERGLAEEILSAVKSKLRQRAI
jgi:TetR/AcrR family transcriptional repressor of nem operon